MAVTWKLKETLERCGITPYRLIQLADGRLTKTAIYNLVNKQPARLEIETLNTILTALNGEGCKVNMLDLLEWDPATQQPLFEKAS